MSDVQVFDGSRKRDDVLGGFGEIKPNQEIEVWTKWRVSLVPSRVAICSIIYTYF